MIISIPKGAIMSFVMSKQLFIDAEISIPKGAIMSRFSVRKSQTKLSISIPKGAIMRLTHMWVAHRFGIFQFQKVRL